MTGAGGQLERAIAEQLAAAGAAVAVVARSAARVDATVAAIRAAGGEADGFTADLADLEAVPEVVQGVERVFGEVDVLVSHAVTVAPLGGVSTLEPAAVLRSLTVNVASVVVLAGAVIPPMLHQRWGRIVNVCAAVGNLVSWPGGNIYAACVAASEAHTVNLAEELSGTGITVNALRAHRAGTALQTWLAGVDPEAVDDPLIRRFVLDVTGLGVAGPDRSAVGLVDRLISTQTGRIWADLS
ncbi:glucose 1-dehydrogenase/3-oxoacyl-[acyl-carrier protein] reductase [Kribbella voronezhensis]|uniref:Glucose 1-dehydrogenase/3-oxoacyl-[acyl-carrier protein] reductase n=1 Tax=Kribbella voronezhensis TaxID=2512212 RepID=A0A4R7SVS9_9ACTN|nr:SDR family NAD(P)-dependent oxidoreductase [Kribbella voronezhensis]TDU83291.1 glucose 1-dehydrogenase/3-oxoacyl-[acyl-carrier protein] reductase [Kribbella voronezhensis]